MFQFNGYVERGGHVSASVTSTGLIVPAGTGVSTSFVQESFPLATVTVYVAGTLTLATIFSDNSGTALANPFTADTAAFFDFFAVAPAYDIVFSGAGITTSWTITVTGTGTVLTSLTDVSKLATSGSGTLADPWIGYEAAVNALPAANGSALTYGANVYFPRGVYLQSSVRIRYKAGWNIIGDGIQNTIIIWSGATLGPFFGLGNLNNTPNNNPIYMHMSDLSIYSTGASTGGAIDDVANTYIHIERIRIQGFRTPLILDQSELVTVRDCIFDTFTRYGVWLLNSANHTVGALPNFTNQIRIEACQFNPVVGAVACINDEGGGGHSFIGNNYNGGQVGIWASNVLGLTISGANTFETAAASDPIHFATTLLTPTFATGAYVGLSRGVYVGGNTFSVATNYAIYIDGVAGGVIEANFFLQQTNAAVRLADGNSSIRIGQNSKDNYSTNRVAAPFISSLTSIDQAAALTMDQNNQTYSTSGFAAGVHTVTPATMGVYGREVIANGQKLWCQNIDGTNGEYVTASGVTATTVDITLAASKAAFFRLSN